MIRLSPFPSTRNAETEGRPARHLLPGNEVSSYLHQCRRGWPWTVCRRSSRCKSEDLHSLVWSQQQFTRKLKRTTAQTGFWQQSVASSLDAVNRVCFYQTADPTSWEQETRSDEDHWGWTTTVSQISYWISLSKENQHPSSSAPHFGGVWERLIQFVKRALLLNLGSAKTTPDVIAAIVSQTDCLVNSPPLTQVRGKHEDDNSLIPNHFLHSSVMRG